jgi:transcription initiation factor TFIID subunit 8
MLSSDDEEAPPAVPLTLRTIPHPLPALPPKHTYLKTPLAPPKKTAIPSLEKKLKTAGLVQDSLKNLLLATEDTTGQEDGELFGHIVNWEATTHPRKRWKVDSTSESLPWGKTHT